MASHDHQEELRQQNTALLTPQQPRRGVLLRRRKLPSIRLGGKRPRRVAALARSVRRGVRLKWLRVRHLWMVMRKLREYYRNLLKDMAEASAAVELFQKRVMLETSFAVPIIGALSFAGSYPNSAGSARPNSLHM